MSQSKQSPSHLKLPQCPICYETYNLTKKRPYFICKNSHSMCRQCYNQHRSSNNYCPICKCQLNEKHRQNDDILTLLTFHDEYSKNPRTSSPQKFDQSNLRQLHSNLAIKRKYQIPKVIQIALLMVGLCVFPLLFVTISQISYLIMDAENFTLSFIISSVQKIVLFLWNFIWTFFSGIHEACTTLCVYDIIYHIVYVIHMILITFLIILFMKWGAQKILNNQQKLKGKKLQNIQLPKNYIERNCLIVLVNFLTWTNKIFQTQNK